MHVDDFREDLRPTRGQWEQIARAFCAASGEPEPATRLQATELLLRLRQADAPDTTPEGPGAAQAAPGRVEGAPQADPSSRPGRISIGGRGAR